MSRRRVLRNVFLAFGACLLAAGCGSVNLWPFGGETARERSRTPTDATEFRCEGGKRFFVRMLNQGASAWVILAEREFRLDRSAGGATYTNGSTTLVVKDGEATLSEGATALYSDCKSGGPGKDGGK